ncbi:putative oxidoreductase [Tolypocladium capitatum]|uniref:Putative oxidoreductase n=1 Tax=Tolypocladium capitatum TaxID=45235 RepID=A0A2K3QPD3_9HYPO|nr:putative oxidoreductase [Tolypocladium capitatum]
MATNVTDAASQSLLITGITGYIGFKTLTVALERGHRVRGVVRSESQASELRSKNQFIAHCHGQVEFVVIPDFLKEGAIRDALDGITAIIHIAAALAIEAEDYEADLVEPAISMVTTLLEAAAQAKTVRRVVLTSSCVTLIPFEWYFDPDSERLYTASDLNATPTRPAKNAMEAYWASKALTRIATRNFVHESKPQFDFVTLLPSVVIGADERIPADGPVSALLQSTRAAAMAPALDGSLNPGFPYFGVPVHVADVARAHVDAVDSSRIPGNSEYILSSDTPEGVVWDRDVHAAARKFFPKEVENGLLPLQGSLANIKWRLDASATESAFGWTFTSFEETMKGLLGQYLQLKQSETHPA